MKINSTEYITMQNKLLVGSLMLSGLIVSLGARASADDCFPACVEPASAVATFETTTEVKLEPITIVTPRQAVAQPIQTNACATGELMQRAEELNDKVKPIRELIGYVRSPQGLVFKLVNDHIVKIPAWVGFAVDPIGSIKHRAIDEVRTRAKDAFAVGKECDSAMTNLPFDEVTAERVSI
ncbi:MAG: hypothetical protein ABI583_03285 [Betaproteobacteria bacterium]